MRFAFAPIRLLPALCVAGAFFTAQDSKAGETELAEFFAKRVSQLDSIVNSDSPTTTKAEPRTRSRSRTTTSQPTTGLDPAKLQTDTNLQATSRGLTPADDWRSMFRRKGR